MQRAMRCLKLRIYCTKKPHLITKMWLITSCCFFFYYCFAYSIRYEVKNFAQHTSKSGGGYEVSDFAELGGSGSW